MTVTETGAAEEGRAIAYEKKSRGRQSFRSHPSRRPPSAVPQDKDLFRGEIPDPHGEEAPKRRLEP
jgi:hypothetical protein